MNGFYCKLVCCLPLVRWCIPLVAPPQLQWPAVETSLPDQHPPHSIQPVPFVLRRTAKVRGGRTSKGDSARIASRGQDTGAGAAARGHGAGCRPLLHCVARTWRVPPVWEPLEPDRRRRASEDPRDPAGFGGRPP
eukprot:gene14383-biopygen18630